MSEKGGILKTYDDLLLPAELLYFSVTASRDSFIFDIEVLLKLLKVLMSPVNVLEVAP